MPLQCDSKFYSANFGMTYTLSHSTVFEEYQRVEMEKQLISY